MKKILRVCAVLLLLSLFLSVAVSCRSEEDETVPDGMMCANLMGDDFRFYVPTSWNLNTMYGVRGAYYNIETISTVSVVKYPITESVSAVLPPKGDATLNAARIDQYRLSYCMPAIEKQATGTVSIFAEETADILLGDAAARKYHMLARVEEQDVHFVQVIAERNNAFYVFTFSCVSGLYDSLLSDMDKMLQNFLFSDKPYDPADVEVEIAEDENTPAGMKPAYREGALFRFYVPETWKINTTHDVCSAYIEADGSNISVVPYIPTQTSMSVEDYFEMNRAEMERVGGEGSFVLLEKKEIELNGRTSWMYDYTWKVGDTTYRYRQAIGAYRGAIYNITYTALPANFENHLADVEAMMGAFVFA